MYSIIALLTWGIKTSAIKSRRDCSANKFPHYPYIPLSNAKTLANTILINPQESRTMAGSVYELGDTHKDVPHQCDLPGM